jgi:hypothetical protein
VSEQDTRARSTQQSSSKRSPEKLPAPAHGAAAARRCGFAKARPPCETGESWMDSQQQQRRHADQVSRRTRADGRRCGSKKLDSHAQHKGSRVTTARGGRSVIKASADKSWRKRWSSDKQPASTARTTANHLDITRTHQLIPQTLQHHGQQRYRHRPHCGHRAVHGRTHARTERSPMVSVTPQLHTQERRLHQPPRKRPRDHGR